MKSLAIKSLAILAAVAAIGFASPSKAGFNEFRNPFAAFQPAHVVAKISLGQQRMELTVVNGMGTPTTYSWKVSTGRDGFDTPTGSFHPTGLDIDHVSKTYDDAKMPFAVFFTGGYAVHATDAVGRLGTAASHGCVRLTPQNAAMFYKLVSTYVNWNI